MRSLPQDNRVHPRNHPGRAWRLGPLHLLLEIA